MEQLFALIITALIVSLVFAYARYKQRQVAEAFAPVAAKLNLSYAVRTPPELSHEGYAHFHLFGPGPLEVGYNALCGDYLGVPTRVFQYFYCVYHRCGNDPTARSTTYNQTVVALRLRDGQLPHFELRPRNPAYSSGSYLGDSETYPPICSSWCDYHDIDVGVPPTFSSAYRLRGKEREAIRSLFTDDLAMFFESSDLCVEGGGDWLIVYRLDRSVPPDFESMRCFLGEALEVREAFAKQSAGLCHCDSADVTTEWASG